jgi:hypothetical protein
VPVAVVEAVIAAGLVVVVAVIVVVVVIAAIALALVVAAVVLIGVAMSVAPNLDPNDPEVLHLMAVILVKPKWSMVWCLLLPWTCWVLPSDPRTLRTRCRLNRCRIQVDQLPLWRVITYAASTVALELVVNRTAGCIVPQHSTLLVVVAIAPVAQSCLILQVGPRLKLLLLAAVVQ